VLVANGSVKRKGKVWSFVVDLGPDPATGRRRQARRSGFATKKAAEAALRDLATAADAGTAVSRSRITVSQFLTDWLETIKPRVRESTWVSYRMVVERITRQIGAVQLQSLTPCRSRACTPRCSSEEAPAGERWHPRPSATATSSSGGLWPTPSASGW
jgi:hypothetical protein